MSANLFIRNSGATSIPITGVANALPPLVPLAVAGNPQTTTSARAVPATTYCPSGGNVLLIPATSANAAGVTLLQNGVLQPFIPVSATIAFGIGLFGTLASGDTLAISARDYIFDEYLGAALTTQQLIKLLGLQDLTISVALTSPGSTSPVFYNLPIVINSLTNTGFEFGGVATVNFASIASIVSSATWINSSIKFPSSFPSTPMTDSSFWTSLTTAGITSAWLQASICTDYALTVDNSYFNSSGTSANDFWMAVVDNNPGDGNIVLQSSVQGAAYNPLEIATALGATVPGTSALYLSLAYMNTLTAPFLAVVGGLKSGGIVGAFASPNKWDLACVGQVYASGAPLAPASLIYPILTPVGAVAGPHP